MVTYGFCRLAGRGCEFSHDPTPRPLAPPSAGEPMLYAATSNYDAESYHFGVRPLETFFVAESLHRDLEARVAALLDVPAPEDERLTVQPLPPVVDKYHTLGFLDLASGLQAPSAVFGLPTSLYKGVSSVDGKGYALRRVDPAAAPVTTALVDHALHTAAQWSRLSHPAIAPLRECFASKQVLGANALFFVHDLCPAAEALADVYSSRSPQSATDTALWAIVLQLLSALRYLAAHGHPCRCLHPTKVLLVAPNRVKVVGLGVLDTLSPVPMMDGGLGAARADLFDLALVVLSAACRGEVTPANALQSLDHVRQTGHYGPDLVHFLAACITGEGGRCTNAEDAARLVPPNRLWEHMALMGESNDVLHTQLEKSLSNGRYARLLAKLGYINDREDMGAMWSETGDRYLLKLFRNYLFHEQDEHGKPLVDLSHLLDCLNKLDAGAMEKVNLTSPDGLSMIRVSYRDLRRITETAFQEVANQQVQ
jgi:PAB-dependent poly(A)-specific ribonuclease subunit 3